MTRPRNNDALVLFKRWKDSRKHGPVFERLSCEYAKLLDIEGDLNNRDLKDIIEIDYYRLIDQKIIIDLVKAVEQRTLSEGEITKLCRERNQSYWHAEFEHLYTAVEVASQFLSQLEAIEFNMSNSSDAVHSYIGRWFKIDQMYRKFIYALKSSGQMTLLSNLTDKIEGLYTNSFLNPLATQWQGEVDKMDSWSVPDTEPQQGFYSRWVSHIGIEEKDLRNYF